MSRPLRSGRAPRPGPDSDGQDATLSSPPRSGRTQCPARARVGPIHLGLACHPTRLSATGYSRPNAPCVPGPALAKAIVDVLWQHPAGAGTFHRGATSTGGLRIGTGPTSRSTSPSSDRLPHGSTSPSSYARANPPTRQTQRRWGGSTPNHPAALQSGMQMGSESPEQHEYLSTRSVMLCSKTITRHARRWKLG